MLRCLRAFAVCLGGFWLTANPVWAQASGWRLHTVIEGEKPFLCKDRSTLDLIVAVEVRGLQAPGYTCTTQHTTITAVLEDFWTGATLTHKA